MATKFFAGAIALVVVVAVVETTAAPPKQSTRRPTTSQKTAPRTTIKPAAKPTASQPTTTPKTEVSPSAKPGDSLFAPPPLPGASKKPTTPPTPPQPKREEDAAKTPAADAPGSPKLAIPHPAVTGEVAPPSKSIATGATVAPDANGKYAFRYHFSNGETIRWRTEHKAKIVTSLQGATQTAETLTYSTKVWKVVETRPGGEAKFVHFVDAIDMRQKLTGRQEVSYNSETDAEVPPIFADAAKQIGVPLAEVTIDARGNILAKSQPTAATMTLVLPDVPLAVGESWTMPIDLSANDAKGVAKSIKARRKLTFEKLDGHVARLKNEVQILSPLTDPAVEAQLVLEHAEQSGTVAFDLAAGRIVEQTSGQDKEVFGFQGAESKLHYVTEYHEALIDGDAAKTAENVDANPLR